MRKHRRYGFVLALAVAGGIAVQSASGTLSVSAAAGVPTTTHTSSTAHVRNPRQWSAGANTSRRQREAARFYSTQVQREFLFSQALKRYASTVEFSHYVQAVAARQAQAEAPAPPAPSGGAWAELRQCESGGNYAEDSGNGYYGAYQFSLSTWEGLGYSGLPSDAPPGVQDAAAQALEARSGWGQWPACSAELGL